MKFEDCRDFAYELLTDRFDELDKYRCNLITATNNKLGCVVEATRGIQPHTIKAVVYLYKGIFQGEQLDIKITKASTKRIDKYEITERS